MLERLSMAVWVAMVFMACSFGIFVVDTIDQTQADSKGRTKLEYDAVRSIHVHLDDDKSGGVDFKESKEFLRDELNVQDHKRHSKFHSGDGSISVEELWKAWLSSEVSKWTADDVADWLKNVVHLPQYANVFIKKQINGRHLPRLASSDDGILLNELNIANVIDRKKIALRAMDVVLFGAPKGHNYVKDFILGLAVLIAMAGFWFSNVQKRKAQKEIEVMMKDVEYLQQAEKDLTRLQNRLHAAEVSHQMIQQEKYQLESNLKNEIETAKREAQRLREAREDHSEEIHTRLKLAEQELVQVREALKKAEKEAEYLSSQMTSSLQKWLQMTYQKEVKNFVYRRTAALKKMENAKEACDRIKRKRSSLFGSLRLVHDQNIDEVDQRILSARTALAEVTNELEELLYRWQQIEMCCRLDLGVSSDFVSDASEVPPSPLGQACSNIGTLGSTNSHSRETLRRVFTYPSFQSVNCNTSYYQSVSKYKLARDVTPTSCYSETFPEVRNAVDKHESEANGHQNASTSEHIKTTDSFDDEQNIICDNVDVKLEVSINDKAMSEIPTGQTLDRNTSKNDLKREGCGENGTIEEVKSEKLSHSSDTKFFLHKKKWWSRNKKYHSLDIDAESETDSKDDHGGSLPNLPQGKASKKHSYNRKHEHLSSKGSKP